MAQSGDLARGTEDLVRLETEVLAEYLADQVQVDLQQTGGA